MIYLDNAATTRPAPAVVEAMGRALTEDPANPSARHKGGIARRERLEEARERIARWCRIPATSVVFTSGGTEANNLAARLPLRARTGRIVTTTAEHSSLAEALRATGAAITEVPLDRHGTIDLGALDQALGTDVGLVALFEGHNELGTRNPLEQIVPLVRARAPHALIHTDSVQSCGKPRPPRFDLDLDSASISGHKIHGPMGVGALLLNTRSRPRPLLLGGGQEQGLRSGTENVPGILGLARAVDLLAQETEDSHVALEARRARLQHGLQESIPGVRVLGEGGPRLPHILSLVLPGALAEPTLHHLEERGILASTGAACTAARRKLSPALLAYGLTEDEVRCTLRLSLSRDTTDREVEQVLAVLPAVVQRLRSLGASR